MGFAVNNACLYSKADDLKHCLWLLLQLLAIVPFSGETTYCCPQML